MTRFALDCPSRDDVLRGIVSLLPRGRAWQTNEGGPAHGWDSPDGETTDNTSQSILLQYWSAMADVVHFATQRLCDLRMEFWCATKVETTDQWMTEYGLPDACDPFPDLCTKVAAIGGTRCEYYAMIAARSGWSIECAEAGESCGAKVGCGAYAGRAMPGRRQAGFLLIRVFVEESSAYTGTLHAIPRAGRLRSGRRLACGPDISALECLLARVVHAEIMVLYEVVQ